MKTCTAYCIAKTFLFNELRDFMLEHYRCAMYKGVLHLEKDSGEAFIFSFGVIVVWDMDHNSLHKLMEELRPFQDEPLQQHVTDEFTYSENNSESRIRDDSISLAKDDILEKLAVSYGIAQSVKLTEFEEYALQTIHNTAHIPRNLAQTGRIKLSRRKIAKMRGHLYIVQSDINLNFDLLDTPEFFWEYPEVEHIYTLTANYLDVKPRIEVLNKKMSVIHELFNMLAEEQKHKHSSVLEWIIIWLITLEVIFFFIHDIFKWL